MAALGVAALALSGFAWGGEHTVGCASMAIMQNCTSGPGGTDGCVRRMPAAALHARTGILNMPVGATCWW